MVSVADVLVVEDDAAIREVVVYQLSRAGHHVDAVGDGVAGLEHFRNARPDLVILDLMLPRLAGLDVLRIVRGEAPVPVIVISARDTEADKITGFDLGADDYLTKPFSVRELLARVQVALRRSGTAAPAAVAPVARVEGEIEVGHGHSRASSVAAIAATSAAVCLLRMSKVTEWIVPVNGNGAS